MQRIHLKQSKNRRITDFIYHIFMILLSLIMVYPFIWSALSSFKTSSQLYEGNPLALLPDPGTTYNYKRLFEVLPFGKFIFNSLYLAIAMPFCMITVASFTAYALTRLRFKGRNVLFMAFVATMMVPSHVTLIPNYKIIVDTGLTNTYTALFLTSMFTGANAFNIFFFRQYFLSIPKDLENAAIVDGCSRFRVYWQIILPNAKPAIATTAILSFRNVWNAFLWPMIVISDYDKLTLTVGLNYLKEWEPNWAVLLAGATVSVVPIIIVFLLFQKQFMSTSINSGFGGK
jgi:multiple sugar transport system permease protein